MRRSARNCSQATTSAASIPTSKRNLGGRHAISNILAGIAVAQVFGIAPHRLTDAVYSLTPGKMRGERLTIDGITIFNDCYNSNPAAARAMIDVLRRSAGRAPDRGAGGDARTRR